MFGSKFSDGSSPAKMKPAVVSGGPGFEMDQWCQFRIAGNRSWVKCQREQSVRLDTVGDVC